jgi:hypothetical protein
MANSRINPQFGGLAIDSEIAIPESILNFGLAIDSEIAIPESILNLGVGD